MRSPTSTPGQSGVTLVETLLAVLVSGLMLLPVTGWATMAMQEQHKVQTRNLSGAALGILRNTFTRDVSESDAAWVEDRKELESCSSGQKGTVAILALGHREGRTTYVLEPDDGAYLLVRLRCAESGAAPALRNELASDVLLAGTKATCATGHDLAKRSVELGREAIGTSDACRRVTLQLTSESLDQVAMTASLRIGGTGVASMADAPTAVATADPTSGRRKLQVRFDGRESTDPNDEPLTFSWDFGEGSGSTDSAPTHVFERIGDHAVTLTVTNSTGLSASTTLRIRVESNPPSAVISTPADRSSFHRGERIEFSSSGSNDDLDAEVGGAVLGYSWDFGDGQTSNEPNPAHAYDRLSPPEGFTVTLTVTDDAGQVGSTHIQIVVANRVPTAKIIAEAIEGVAPFSVDFATSVEDETTMAVNPPLSYSWDFGNGETSDQANPLDVVYSNEGTYTVHLTVTDDVGATSTATQDIVVKTSSIPAPKNLRRVRAGAVPGGLRYIDIAWSPVEDIDAYQVEAEAEKTSERLFVDSPNVTVRLNDLSKGAKYYRVRVRALGENGEFGQWSNWVRMRS